MFKEYLESNSKSNELTESAQMKLDLITKIGSLMGQAELSDLKKILKILEKTEPSEKI